MGCGASSTSAQEPQGHSQGNQGNQRQLLDGSHYRNPMGSQTGFYAGYQGYYQGEQFIPAHDNYQHHSQTNLNQNGTSQNQPVTPVPVPKPSAPENPKNPDTPVSEPQVEEYVRRPRLNRMMSLKEAPGWSASQSDVVKEAAENITEVIHKNNDSQSHQVT